MHDFSAGERTRVGPHRLITVIPRDNRAEEVHQSRETRLAGLHPRPALDAGFYTCTRQRAGEECEFEGAR